jgi:hypothetical protein
MHRFLLVVALAAAGCVPQVEPASPTARLSPDEAVCLARLIRPDSDLTAEIRRLNGPTLCEAEEGSVFFSTEGFAGSTQSEKIATLFTVLGRITPEPLAGTADQYARYLTDRLLPVRGPGELLAGVPGATAIGVAVVETAGVSVALPGTDAVLVCVAGLTSHTVVVTCRGSADASEAARTLVAKRIIERDLPDVVW